MVYSFIRKTGSAGTRHTVKETVSGTWCSITGLLKQNSGLSKNEDIFMQVTVNPLIFFLSLYPVKILRTSTYSGTQRDNTELSKVNLYKSIKIKIG